MAGKNDVSVEEIAKAAGRSVDVTKRALGILIGMPASMIVKVPAEVARNAAEFVRRNTTKGS